jgi:hypothetical protein
MNFNKLINQVFKLMSLSKKVKLDSVINQAFKQLALINPGFAWITGGIILLAIGILLEYKSRRNTELSADADPTNDTKATLIKQEEKEEKKEEEKLSSPTLAPSTTLRFTFPAVLPIAKSVTDFNV